MQYLGCNTTRKGRARQNGCSSSAVWRQRRTERSSRDSMQVYSEVASTAQRSSAPKE
jgi:hypothetical protein